MMMTVLATEDLHEWDQDDEDDTEAVDRHSIKRSAREGFELYLKHKAVIGYALKRLKIVPANPAYEDLFHEGMLVYVDYFTKYDEPLEDTLAIKKFNRLAGLFVYRRLIDRLQRQYRRVKLTERLAEQPPAEIDRADYLAPDLVETNEILTLLYKQLTSRERQVLIYRYEDQLRDSEIAERLGISQQRIGQLRRAVINKYQLLLARLNRVD